jgi:hypothetical protein
MMILKLFRSTARGPSRATFAVGMGLMLFSPLVWALNSSEWIGQSKMGTYGVDQEACDGGKGVVPSDLLNPPPFPPPPPPHPGGFPQYECLANNTACWVFYVIDENPNFAQDAVLQLCLAYGLPCRPLGCHLLPHY